VEGCCECGDEPSGSSATELVSQFSLYLLTYCHSVCSDMNSTEVCANCVVLYYFKSASTAAFI
jgi:formate-dependent nitrite reductase cytochrome c552 subunit